MTKEMCAYCEEGELDETYYDTDRVECEVIYRCPDCGVVAN